MRIGRRAVPAAGVYGACKLRQGTLFDAMDRSVHRACPTAAAAVLLVWTSVVFVPMAAAQAPLPAQVSPLPGMVPAAPAGPVRAATPETEPHQQDMPDVAVEVTAAHIEGASVFAPDDLAPLLDGVVGSAVPLARIEAARLAILRHYRAAGYALTAVSAVIEPDGLLRLRVTEGRIAAVKLDGDIGPAGVQVLRLLEVLTEAPVIDNATLERQLLLAGDVPGVSLRAVLRPSADEPGALTLVAQVSRRAVAGQVTLDNRAFTRVGPVQGLGVIDFNSFSSLGEHVQIELYRTMNGAQVFGQVNADAFLGSSGMRLRLYGGSGVSRPTGPFRSIGYRGLTNLFGAELAYPLVRSRGLTLNLVGTLDADEGLVDQNGQRSSTDSLRVGRVGVEYVASDALLGAERPAVNGVTIRLSRGLSGFADPARTGQKVGFTKVTLDATRTQTLFQISETSSVAVLTALAGQYTRNALPGPEEFFLGGSRLARGFYYGEATGDNALAGTVELQWNAVHEVPAIGAPELSAQYYGFADWARTAEIPRLDQSRLLISAGIGVRLIPTPRLELDFEGVNRFTRYPAGSGPGIAPVAAHAFYWRLLARF